MSVMSSNIFDILDDDAPPKDAPKKVEKKEDKKKDTRKEKPQRDNKPQRNNNRAERPRGDRTERGDRSGARRGGRGGGRGGKREFDRRSGTDRNDREKRSGNGKYNWGGEGEDNRPRRAPRADKEAETKDETPKVEGEVPKEVEVKEGEAAVEEGEPVEVEPETCTYDEYLQKQKDNALAEDTVVKREVNNDDFQGQVATAFAKVDSDDEDGRYVLGTTKKGKKGKGKKVSKQLNIDEFKAQNGGGRGNQQRGNRGGKGKGNSRGNSRAGNRKINTNDAAQFPALGQ